MKAFQKIKEHLFLFIVILSYLLLLIFKPSLGVEAVKSSGYYLKEMLMIMPVIFVLTALLDMWVAKEKIVQYLGKEAKAKGVLFSFALGSLSAGPVYAAFPLCAMFYKKGASIRNIVIILSSWAVIKLPMLLNEAKFLGLEFMALRWGLTVLAILIFSWLTAKLIKREDLPSAARAETGLTLNQDACIGCNLCVRLYPEVFAMEGKKAYVKAAENLQEDEVENALEVCPVTAISYHQDQVGISEEARAELAV